jgi:hypothetical protein
VVLLGEQVERVVRRERAQRVGRGPPARRRQVGDAAAGGHWGVGRVEQAQDRDVEAVLLPRSVHERPGLRPPADLDRGLRQGPEHGAGGVGEHEGGEPGHAPCLAERADTGAAKVEA